MAAPRTPAERFPEIFHQTQIDRRGRSRNVEMKLLVLGMMRTGTMSIRAALLELGYKGVYHMFEAVQNPPDAEFWVDAFRWKYFGQGRELGRKDWDGILGDYEACMDMPTAALMPELIAAYPDAKVIVAMRDPEAWWKSVSRSVGKEHRTLNSLPAFLRTLLMKIDPTFLGRFFPMAHALEFGPFGERGFADPEHCKKVYVAIHDEVRALVPRDRLLGFQLAQGWEPLCEFLGKEVPETAFPHLNESREFEERARLIQKHVLTRAARRVLPTLSVFLAGAVAGYSLKFSS